MEPLMAHSAEPPDNSYIYLYHVRASEHWKPSTLICWMCGSKQQLGQEVQRGDQFTVSALLDHLIYPATALWRRSCKKLKNPSYLLSSPHVRTMNLMLGGENIRLFMVY